MIFKILQSGISQMWTNKRLVILFYLTNLIAAAIIIWPLRVILNQFVGHSLMGENLLRGFDVNFLFEFLQYKGKSLNPILFSGIILMIIYWLFILLISAGVFNIFASRERYSAANFWGSAGHYFGRFLRLFFYSLFVLTIFMVFPQIVSLLKELIFGKDPYEYINFYAKIFKVILYLIAFFLWLIIFDYARIQVVLSDETKMRKSLWQALQFCRHNFSQVLQLALVLSFIGICIFFLTYFIVNQMNNTDAIVIGILFFMQQIFMIFRAMLKLTSFACETELSKRSNPL